jgi:outer membrane protein assembly factor BamB
MPETIGVGQIQLINLWTFPSPATSAFSFAGIGFHDVVITFTRPDGSTDSFKPIHGSGELAPGVTETLGAIWFHYVPNQVGTWTVSYTQPEQVVGEAAGDPIIYEAATSTVTTFVVQQDPVQIGETPRAMPGPNEYWDRPINAEHREWSRISGDWLGSKALDGSSYNAYSTGPKSAHIAWKVEVASGGLVGGPWGSLSYPAGSFGGGGSSPPLIIGGRVYYRIPGGMFRCVDIRTGETLWEMPGSISSGKIERPFSRSTRTPEVDSANTNRYIWGFSGGVWTRYNAWDGTPTSLVITGVPSGIRSPKMYGEFGYCAQQGTWNNTIPYRRDFNRLYKVDMTRGGTFADKVVWNVTMKQPDGSEPGSGNRGSGMILSADGSTVVVFSAGEDTMYAYNTDDGSTKYVKNVGFMMMLPSPFLGPPGGDTVFHPESETMDYHMYDINTGTEIWEAQIGEYPWGVNTRPYGFAYGLAYFMSYDGHVYALDANTGAFVWKFYTGDNTETPMGTWAPFLGQCIADEIYYIGTSEHTPTQPRMRGAKLFALNALTGDEIWRISGGLKPKAIADGTLLCDNEYDGRLYAFGKGKTETTASIQNDVIEMGSKVLITGTVLDMSPAAPGTPAVSESSMTAYMEYLHMQKPMPMDTTGVSVKLTAIDPNGNYQDLGTATSDATGNFGKSWTPPVPGTYMIIASFEGSESYWPSMETTYLEVNSPSPAGQMEPELTTPTLTEAPFITTEIAIIMAVAVAVVIGTAATWALKKRK